jgi:hypothetical protein
VDEDDHLAPPLLGHEQPSVEASVHTPMISDVTIERLGAVSGA